MINVHTVPGSPYTRGALIACIEKGAPYRVLPLGPGETKQAAHLARHPFGRMPAIDDDGFGLYETQAIIRYVDAVYGAPRALTPKDPKAEARMNQAIGILDWYFFAPGAAIDLVFNRVVAPKLGFPSDDAKAAAAVPATRYVVGVLAGFLANGSYIAGDAFSLADVHLGPHLDMLAECAEGAEMVKGTPVAGWLERLNARPSFAATTWDRVAEAAKASMAAA
jgi:glutathione S-transferase